MLEHVPDDDSALRELARVLRRGGRAWVTVPHALRHISPILRPANRRHDRRLGHLRRYEAESLIERAQSVGLEAIDVQFTGHPVKLVQLLGNRLNDRLWWWCEARDRRRSSDRRGSMQLSVVLARRSRDVRAIAAEAAVVLLLTTAFVCALFWRLLGALGTTLLEPGSDAPGAVGWLYALRHESGYHLFGTVHHTITGAPFGWDESNALNLQWLIPYFPGYLLTKVVGTLSAFNLVLLSGYVLSGGAMYFLVRYVGCGRLVAGWAGLVYIVFPWHLMRVPHPSLVHLEFFPLLLAALIAAVRRPTWPRFGLVAAATLASWLTSGYYGAMAVIITIAFALGILGDALVRLRPSRFLVLATTSALVGTVTVGAVARAADVGRTTGLNRRLQDVHAWGLHVDELFVPAARNFVFGRWTEGFLRTHQHGSYTVETTNYLGFVTIVLAVAWLLHVWRRRETVAASARLVDTGVRSGGDRRAFLFALPGPVSIGGHSVWTPSRFLWQVVPRSGFPLAGAS